MKEKILLVLLILALCLSTCQTEYYPAAGYSSMMFFMSGMLMRYQYIHSRE